MKKIKNIFCMLISACLMFGNIAVLPVSATEDDTLLAITQKYDTIDGSSCEQEYTLSYKADGTNGATENSESNAPAELSISFDKGLTPKTLTIGSWDYTGSFSVFCKKSSDDNEISIGQPDENGNISLEGQNNITEIIVRTDNPVDALINFQDCIINGTVEAGDAGKELTVNATYQTSDADQATASLTMKCNDYSTKTPKITTSSGSVEYLSSGTIKISDIEFDIVAGCPDNMEVKISVPSNILIDSVVMPTFDNAFATLYADGKLFSSTKEKIYVSASVDELVVKLALNDGTSSNVKQTRDMEISFRNVVNSTASQNVKAESIVAGASDEINDSANAVATLSLVKKVTNTSTTSTKGSTSGTSSGTTSSGTHTDSSSGGTQESTSGETKTESETSGTTSTYSSTAKSTTSSSSSTNQSTGTTEEVIEDVIIIEDEDGDEEEELEVVDYSGLNLISASASPRGINTILHSEEGADSSGSETTLSKMSSDPLQTESVQELENVEEEDDPLTSVTKDDATNEQDNISLNGNTYGVDGSDEINRATGDMTSSSSQGNRGTWIFIVLAIIVIAAIIAALIIRRNSSRQEENGADSQDESDDIENSDEGQTEDNEQDPATADDENVSDNDEQSSQG